MAYDYQTERPRLLTTEGIRNICAARDNAKRLYAEAGCVRMDKLWKGMGGTDSWGLLAAVDWLVEEGFLVEVKLVDEPCGQHRIFVLKGWP